MRFINRTGNTHNLGDVGKLIPFLGDQEQEIDADTVKRSSRFQSLVISRLFEITEAGDDRMEQNLLKIQRNEVNFTTDEDIKVIFRGHFGGNTGYAKANRNLLYGMTRAGIDVALSPLSDIAGVTGTDQTLLERFRKLPSEDAIFIHSTIPTFYENVNCRYRILYTTVEASTIPKQFIDCCDNYDEVWTVSDFCRDVFLNHGLKKPIYIVPNSVDHRLYSKDIPKEIPFKPALRKFTFVSVFSWNYRKGYDALIKAYLQTFSRDDDVSLLLVSRYNTDNSGLRTFKADKEIRSFVEKYGGTSPAHIARCGNPVDEADMPRVYKSCHCLVLPTRGEGFGIPFMEASLCGLPVIATDYSGQKMFLNGDNSYLLKIDRLSPANSTGVHYWDGQVFPELTDEETIRQLGELMRDVYTNYSSAQMKNEVLRQNILSQYTCEAVGNVAKQRLEVIWKLLS